MPAQKPIIMYDAPEAASLQTVTGWVSADGRFFGTDEDLARYCGATHRRCDVNPEHQIYAVNSYCAECRQARRQAKFAAMPIKEWAGEPLVIFDGDKYFLDEDSLRYYLIDSDIDLADLQLCICEPNYPSQIDPADHFCDDLPEDGEIRDDQLLAAFELLNEMIRQSEPLSWSGGEFAASLPQSLLNEVAAARVTP
ncbi:hypothetical protein JFV28_20180 [Pseudomonas sp. TH05]|uniref:hypothetical protein n=1 Tax=unclassified Pseudomonas TaxID=196821 RepID=UPI0019112E2C|nr:MULTISPECIES: hypothetical protein [unclassified Pseudomonas]MBK5541558.1 hypothetical protein [Pseudomonas sp. TH07]MBK5558163.1 hypothetical protein [Pseudomonas sp. TH05]